MAELPPKEASGPLSVLLATGPRACDQLQRKGSSVYFDDLSHPCEFHLFPAAWLPTPLLQLSWGISPSLVTDRPPQCHRMMLSWDWLGHGSSEKNGFRRTTNASHLSTTTKQSHDLVCLASLSLFPLLGSGESQG